MYSNKKLIVICDLQSVQDDNTGDRTISVLNATKVIGQKDLAGVQTQTLAQMQNMIVSYSVIIDRMFYNNQKYLYVDNNLYKIQNVTPAKLAKDCKLNIVEFYDSNIINAIEEWLQQ